MSCQTIAQLRRELDESNTRRIQDVQALQVPRCGRSAQRCFW
jgi:hypothetical protein